MSTVAPFVAVWTTVCPNRRPPRPKHSKFTQFHRSGLHFGRIHPQHRQCGDSSKAYGDCHSVRGRQSLAGHRKRRTEPHVNNLPHRHGGRRRTRKARPRCRWAAAWPGHASRRRTEPHQSPRPHRCGERRKAWLRYPWAAAWPGRASRRRAERRSQRGRLAGGPPPTGTGTPSSPTQRLPETTTTRKPQCLPRPQRPRRALRAGPGRGSG